MESGERSKYDRQENGFVAKSKIEESFEVAENKTTKVDGEVNKKLFGLKASKWKWIMEILIK